jgi:hypothetical protein
VEAIDQRCTHLPTLALPATAAATTTRATSTATTLALCERARRCEHADDCDDRDQGRHPSLTYTDHCYSCLSQ